MNRFCSSCGSELPANVKFCTTCGTAVTPPATGQQAPPPPPPAQPWQPAPAPQPPAPQPPAQQWQPTPQAWPPAPRQGGGNGAKIALLSALGLGVVTVAIVLLVILFGGSDPVSVVKDYTKASNAHDCEKVAKLTYFQPQDGDSTSDLRSSFIDDCKSNLSDSEDGEGGDYKQTSFKATKGDPMTASDFEDNQFPKGVTEARQVNIRETYTYTDSDGTTHDGCYTTGRAVVKVDGDWLVFNDYSFDEGSGGEYQDCGDSSGSSDSSSGDSGSSDYPSDGSTDESYDY